MISDANMYAEVFEILGCMKKEEVIRIPVNILEFIKQERNKNYKTRIDKYDLFNPDNIDQRSINLLTWLMISYMGNEKEKAELIRIGKENDRKREEDKKAMYSTDIFNKTEEYKEKSFSKSNEDKSLIAVEKSNSIFTYIVEFFKNIFKK